MTITRSVRLVCFAALVSLLAPRHADPADHNDPNAINSIFSDVPRNGADLYDLFGYPQTSTGVSERVMVALTSAPMP